MPSRSYGYDFLAGVDPTGGHTFQYGVADAPKPSGAQGVRRAVGIAGGLLGGGLVVPAVISAVVTAARESPKGLKGMAKGFAKGLTRTNIDIIRALGASKALSKIEKGKAITAREIKHLKSMEEVIPVVGQFKNILLSRKKQLKGVAGELAGQAAEARLSSLARKHGIPEKDKAIAALYDLPKDMIQSMQSGVKGEAAQSLAGLALSGVIGGGSAFLQYGKGSRFGSVLTKKQRQKLTKESEVKYEAMKDELDKLSFVHLAPEQSYLVSSLLAKAISSSEEPGRFRQRPKYHGMMKTSASFKETFDEMQQPLSTWKRLMAENRNTEQALKMLESLKRKRFGARINMI